MAADITIWTITSSLPSDVSVYVYNGFADNDTGLNINWVLIDSFPSSVDLNNGLSIKVIRNNENITKNISYSITGGTPHHARLIIYNKSNAVKYDDHLYIDNNGVFTINLDLEEQSAPSIGNIPMGELTFNGVQSVTYNGTDYTKLVVDGTSYPPPLPVTISFTIKGTSYQAEVGMTWREWVASSYNTGGFICIEIADGLEYDFSLSASKNVIAESSSTSINGYAVCVLAGDGSSNATCVSPEDVINEILPYVVRGYMD